MGQYFKNGALWILLTALGFFALLVTAIGSDTARDVIDLAAICLGTILFFRFLPHAIDRFNRGGGLQNWQLLMSNCLFWGGLVGWRIWAYVVRYAKEQDPHGAYVWMSESWINGFWPYWILGAGVLSLRASTETPPALRPTMLYYLAIGLGSGILIGVAVTRFLMTAPAP